MSRWVTTSNCECVLSAIKTHYTSLVFCVFTVTCISSFNSIIWQIIDWLYCKCSYLRRQVIIHGLLNNKAVGISGLEYLLIYSLNVQCTVCPLRLSSISFYRIFIYVCSINCCHIILCAGKWEISKTATRFSRTWSRECQYRFFLTSTKLWNALGKSLNMLVVFYVI